MAEFVEQACVVEHEGQKFESSGAWLAKCSDGYMRGVVYAKPMGYKPYSPTCGGIVTDWHGNKLADAVYGRQYQGNLCKMRCVAFTVDGVKYAGRWCPDWADAVRVRSTKRV